jgi:hypothetical protein
MFHDLSKLSNQILSKLLSRKKERIKAKELVSDVSQSPENYDNRNTI